MSIPISINTAICLPASDVAALGKGRMIAALSRTFVSSTQQFALCPVEAQNSSSTISINLWAKLEFCKIYSQSEDIEKLARLTIWSNEELQKALQERYKLFLLCLRVYNLPQPLTISVDRVITSKLGNFIKLPGYLAVTNFIPVLTDDLFIDRKQQLISLEPPLHPELEELLDSVSKLAIINSLAKELEHEIKAFLGWNNRDSIYFEPDLSWIKTIANIGNSSDGFEFEKLVRKSFIKLGFSNSLNNSKASLHPEETGGSGGIDFYCNAPYSVVGECKATKTESVSDGTPAQLLKLGKNHLGKEQYDSSIKIIFAAGGLNSYAQRTAKEHDMNVIRPETLQRLVELKLNYPNSVDLFELKPCLEKAPFGEESDSKLNSYIDKKWKSIKIRSDIVRSVKQLAKSDQKQLEVIEIKTYYNAMFGNNDKINLDNETVHEILIELSSPLVGNLGRVKGTSLQSDRFYFLRDMPEVS